VQQVAVDFQPWDFQPWQPVQEPLQEPQSAQADANQPFRPILLGLGQWTGSPCAATAVTAASGIFSQRDGCIRERVDDLMVGFCGVSALRPVTRLRSQSPKDGSRLWAGSAGGGDWSYERRR
jgi:hypothetical protein